MKQALALWLWFEIPREKLWRLVSEKIILPPSVVILETITARRAIHLIHELDLPSSIFEGDSEISIKALQQKNSLHPSFSHLIKKNYCLQLVLFKTILLHILLGMAMLWRMLLAKKTRFSFLLQVWIFTIVMFPILQVLI